MAEIRPMVGAAIPASLVLGRKLDSIPFSGYHVLIIAVLALVGFIEGYDLVMTGSLVVLAKEPLHLTSSDIRILVAFPTFMLTLGGFFFSAISDHLSRKIIVLIGVFLTTFLTLLIPLVQNAEQLIDHSAPVDGYRCRRRGFGGLPDRRRADAGTASAHL